MDIKLDGSDLLKSSVRLEIEKEVERLDPYCVSFAPVCGPWGPWSRLNMAKNEKTPRHPSTKGLVVSMPTMDEEDDKK